MTKFTPYKELTTRYGGEIVMRNREPIELRSNETHKKASENQAIQRAKQAI
jgi:hypothetical protein